MADNPPERAAAHQIGEAAELTGLSLRTIRHYEEVGLVSPSTRSAGGFRLYSDAEVDRLRLVKQMKPLGFTLEEMRELLDTRDRLADADSDGADELRDRLAMFAEVAEERCAQLRAQLTEVETLATRLRNEATAPSRTTAAGKPRR
ncbi:MAG: MerR family transcriptional regulator [Acidimicrobiia bacterium]|nr:MerR family transcriptional regulator [Acidimicrobiia bacterium]